MRVIRLWRLGGLAILSGAMACRRTPAPPPVPAVSVTQMDFIFHTKDDDKDRGQNIRLTVLKDSTTVIYRSNWIGGDIVYRNDSDDSWRVPNGEQGGLNSPMTLADCRRTIIRIETSNDDGWRTSFEVWGNNRAVQLVSPTRTVLFGRHAPDVGPRSHDFKFTCTG